MGIAVDMASTEDLMPKSLTLVAPLPFTHMAQQWGHVGGSNGATSSVALPLP